MTVKYNNSESQTRVTDDIPMSKKDIRNSAVEIFKVMTAAGYLELISSILRR